MSVSCINYDSVGTGVYQCLHTLQCVDSHTHTGSHTQSALGILACHWFVFGFSDVLVCNQAYEFVVFVDNGQFLDFVLLKNLSGSLKVAGLVGSHQIFLCHNLVDALVHIPFKTQIPVSHDANQMTFVVDHRNSSNLIFCHDAESVVHGRAPFDCHWVVNHTVFSTFHDCNLTSLLLDAHIFMNHTDAALACNGYSHLRLGHSVHRRCNKRYLQFNVA